MKIVGLAVLRELNYSGSPVWLPWAEDRQADGVECPMKKVPLVLALILASLNIVAGQTQTRERRSNEQESAPRSDSTAVRTRVVGPIKAANHADRPQTSSQVVSKQPEPSSSGQVPQQTVQPAWGDTAVVTSSASKDSTPTMAQNSASIGSPRVQNNQPRTKLVEPTTMTVAPAPSVRLLPLPERTAVSANTSSTRIAGGAAVYRVGVGDVLDIRLVNMPTRESTLFTIMKNGALEYPLLNTPVNIDGLTTDEVSRLLSNEIKVIAGARVTVSVRDYASHGVVVTGFVDSPGRKNLRREAMPLYAVLAESLPRPEALSATIVRAGKEQVLMLADEKAMNTLVLPGDVIKVSGGTTTVKRFVYVGGEVNAPGEKEFRESMTLTQALLSAGGASRAGKNSVKVARRNATGFLITNEYNLSAISDGKSPDPLVQAGDRIEVTRGM